MSTIKERIGYKNDYLHDIVSTYAKVSNMRSQLSEDHEYNQSGKNGPDFGDWIRDGFDLISLAHLGVLQVTDVLSMPEWMPICLATREYFSGDWRIKKADAGSYTTQEMKTFGGWLREWQMSLVYALITCDSETINFLGKHLDMDFLGTDPHPIEPFKVSDSDICVYIAQWMRGEDDGTLAKKAKSKPFRPKWIARGLMAISKSDQAAVEKAITQLIANHIEEVYPDDPYDPWRITSLCGSIVYGLASREGMDLPGLSQETMDRIMTRDSLGLDN